LNAAGFGMFVCLAICSFLVGTAARGQDEAVELARSGEALEKSLPHERAVGCLRRRSGSDFPVPKGLWCTRCR